MNLISHEQLRKLGVADHVIKNLAEEINQVFATYSGEKAWKIFSTTLLNTQLPFTLHLFLFSRCYPNWQTAPYTAPVWIPDKTSLEKSHLTKCIAELKQDSLTAFHTWSIKNPIDFWQFMLQKLNIQFMLPPKKICDLSQGIECPNWLVGAKFNIVNSCFKAAPQKIALIQQTKGQLEYFTYEQLDKLSNQIANSLNTKGLMAGDAIAINMPMHKYAVAIYLAILKIGGIVVSIADSFSAEEISSRLQIANAKAIFTQDIISRGTKIIPLYEKVIAANASYAIVLANDTHLNCSLRQQDSCWQDFLVDDEIFSPVPCHSASICNILFSSGTTGNPKAIPWTHTTPIKIASDAYLHHDIHENDILAWPTNLGWMMGPWLIFAALINNAAIALYDDVPHDRNFGKFVEHAKVTMLGVIPTLVAHWRQTNCMWGLNWQQIKCFSSSGECSNPEDMFYLMALANYKPIIEYCGGTEIGGAYITSTLIEKNYPTIFTTAAMGIDFLLLNEKGELTDNGEVALLPPSIGLSTSLLNANHHEIYFANMPIIAGKILRRHGDQIQCFNKHQYCVLGRVDDTMNLGGIKVSAAEIERTLVGIENIIETAAIAVNLNHHGPSYLVIFAVANIKLAENIVKQIMQKRINQYLNPLFKIHEVIFIDKLPRTASNKIMRRVLRNQYQSKN